MIKTTERKPTPAQVQVDHSGLERRLLQQAAVYGLFHCLRDENLQFTEAAAAVSESAFSSRPVSVQK